MYNLNIHYINDIPKYLQYIRRILHSGGVLLASFFAEDTLIELKTSILEAEISLNLPARSHVIPMISMKNITRLMQEIGYSEIVISMNTYELIYKDMSSLMIDLRNAGQSNILQGKHILSRDVLHRANSIYQDRFHSHEDKGVIASFDVVFIAASSYIASN